MRRIALEERRMRRFTPEHVANDGGFLITEHRALDTEVLAVAVERAEGWTAYIGAVPGFNHDAETERVARLGAKLHEPFARVLFPFYEDEPFIP